jgi:hypothetical protein
MGTYLKETCFEFFRKFCYLNIKSEGVRNVNQNIGLTEQRLTLTLQKKCKNDSSKLRQLSSGHQETVSSFL